LIVVAVASSGGCLVPPRIRKPLDLTDTRLRLSGTVGSWVPVQGEGLLDDKPWYFRARGEHWSFTLAEKGGNVHNVRPMFHSVGSEPGWVCERNWPFGEFSAGWMPWKTARAIIRICARAYLAGVLPRVEPEPEIYAREEREMDECLALVPIASKFSSC